MESPTKAEKPLTIDKAAFLLLRVRKVFKKKIQLKKEKNTFAQDVVFPKSAELTQINLSKPAKKSRIPPLIRSRTVPAIIVPFSILQAQLVKTAPSTANNPASAPITHHAYPKDVCGKSDFATPGLDYVQFLTGGTGSPTTSSYSLAGTPPSRHQMGHSNPSLLSRESISGSSGGDSSSWNVNLTTPSKDVLSCSDRSQLSSISPDTMNSNIGGAGPNPPSQHQQASVSPNTSGQGGRGFSRIARLLNTPGAEERRKSSTTSLQHYHTSHAQHVQHQQQKQQAQLFAENLQNPSQWTLGSDLGSCSSSTSWATYATPRLQRRRSLEDEDLGRPRSVSIDSQLKSHFLLPDGTFKSFSVAKRLSTGSANQAKIDNNKCNQGFVAAVEQGNVAKVKSILESSDLDINSLSLDGLSLLDVAVIQRNGPMVKILLANGGTESEHYKESIGDQLNNMVHEAEKKSEDLMARLLKSSTFGNLSSAQLKELEKEFHLWEKRFKKRRDQLLQFNSIGPPDPPAKVTVDVISSTAVRIRFQEADNQDNSICTKYKIEWSLEEDFALGTTTKWMEMLDLRKMETVLSDLETGRRYYFRVTAGNCKGYGFHQNSTPSSVVPSSWRDVDGKKSRYAGKTTIFDDIFGEIQRARPEYASEIRSIDFRTRDSLVGSDNNSLSSQSTKDSNQQGYQQNYHHQPHHMHHHYSLHGYPQSSSSQHQKTKNQKIISIKQLFASAPKFQKNFKRGIFLSCVIYSEDKLLVTNEEFLPTIEIDETFPSSLHNDFHWLLKVASTWEDVKSFKSDMEKSGSASTFHFRLKLLQAAAAMQTALGVTDLGRLYYKTIRDKTNSVVVITTINYMRSTKLISSLNVRWVPLTKMSSRKSTDDMINDVLINSIQEQILYHQVSNIPVGRGLYLGYLKLASSVDVLKIVVAEKQSNMLPHAKIRENPHVSSEEWTLIQKLAKSKSLDSLNNYEANNNSSGRNGGNTGADEKSVDESNGEENVGGKSNPGQSQQSASAEFSEAQELFRSQLNNALKRIFSFLEIDYESSLNHRMYNAEVIEVSNSVSLLVVFPSLENVCLVAGQSDKLLQRNDLIPLPVQVFEMIHLSTYQKDFVTRYARLSAILEIDTILAQHNQREAFSSSEMATAKQRMSQLQDLQSKIDSTWKGSRWVIDVVTASRDKASTSASIRALAQFDLKTISSESIVSADACLRKSEEIQLGLHSKSEQQLPFGTLKFSRSENQLSNCGGPGGAQTGSGHHSRHSHSLHCHSAHHLAGIRKISVPTAHTSSGERVDQKLQFNPKIYSIHSTHSQSDSTISHSVSTAEILAPDQISSTSLHNLYRQTSSNQIVVPNLVVSGTVEKAESEPSSKTNTKTTTAAGQQVDCTVTVSASFATCSTNVPVTSPVTPQLATTHHPPYMRKYSAEPPPVPPRRTIPPPPPPFGIPGPSGLDSGSSSNLDIRVYPTSNLPGFPAVDPPPPNIPSVSVRMFDSSTSSNSSMMETGDPLSHLQQQSSSPSVVVIQVFAAYESGMSEGTSLRLQITNQTTARQVVDLVVKQLNAEVKAKGLDHPVYERTQDFCLVSVIGARERCLRNDFKPLLLQNPWKSEGKLFIRKKNEVTAAVDYYFNFIKTSKLQSPT